eukprot:4918267-Pyramimonas_sp.AAC.1
MYSFVYSFGHLGAVHAEAVHARVIAQAMVRQHLRGRGGTHTHTTALKHTRNGMPRLAASNVQRLACGPL